MGYLSLLCFLFVSVALIDAKTLNIPVDPEIMPKLVQASSYCIASTGIKDDIFKQLIELKLDDNESTKKLLFCFGTKLNYIDKKGHVVVDEAVKLTVSKKRKVLADTIRRCDVQEGSDKYDTLFKIIICARDQANIVLSI